MKYYVQYKRSTDPIYRTHGSLNSAREVMDVLRTGRQLDSNLHYIWARYQANGYTERILHWRGTDGAE